MRKSEMTVGGEYALVEYDGQTPRRVRVEAFNQPRHVFSGSRDYRGHTTNDGTLVTFLDTETGREYKRTKVEEIELDEPVYEIGKPPRTTEEREVEYLSQSVVINAHIKRPWESQVSLNEDKAKSEAASKVAIAKAEAEVRAINEALVKIGVLEEGDYKPRVTFAYRRSTRVGYGGYTEHGTVEIPRAALYSLIRRAGL